MDNFKFIEPDQTTNQEKIKNMINKMWSKFNSVVINESCI